MRNLDSDYEAWRHARYKQFSEDFNAWRSARQGGGQGSTGGRFGPPGGDDIEGSSGMGASGKPMSGASAASRGENSEVGERGGATPGGTDKGR